MKFFDGMEGITKDLILIGFFSSISAISRKNITGV